MLVFLIFLLVFIHFVGFVVALISIGFPIRAFGLTTRFQAVRLFVILAVLLIPNAVLISLLVNQNQGEKLSITQAVKKPPQRNSDAEIAKKTIDSRKAVQLPKLVKTIESGDFVVSRVLLSINLKDFGEDERKRIEKILIDAVKPVPASDLDKNRLGYRMLAMVAPQNKEYKEKEALYSQKIKSEKEKQKAKLFGKFRKKKDKVSGTTFYTHPNSPRYLNSRSSAYLYIGKIEEHYFLRLKIQYTANDWLFVNNVIAYRDGKSSTLYDGSFERDHNTDIWEWVDVNPSKHQLEILAAIGSAKESILRFEGQQYRKDVTLRKNDKVALKEVLAAYKAVTN